MNKIIQTIIAPVVLCIGFQVPLFSMDNKVKESPYKRPRLSLSLDGSGDSDNEVLAQLPLCKEKDATNFGESVSKPKFKYFLIIPNIIWLKHLYLPACIFTPLCENFCDVLVKSNLSLETLHLSQQRIGDEGVKVIVASQTLQKFLKNLNLDGNGITYDGVKLLANNMTNLTHLKLSFNSEIGDRGAIAIALGNLHYLKVLGLERCFIELNGLSAIMNSQCLSNLTSLDLDGNVLGDKSVETFTQGTLWKQLTSLSLQDTGITHTGISNIARQKKGPLILWSKSS